MLRIVENLQQRWIRGRNDEQECVDNFQALVFAEPIDGRLEGREQVTTDEGRVACFILRPGERFLVEQVGQVNDRGRGAARVTVSTLLRHFDQRRHQLVDVPQNRDVARAFT
jgi:hypothetical protein